MPSALHDEAGVIAGSPAAAGPSPFIAEPLSPTFPADTGEPTPLLRQADFLNFWGAQAVSQLGSHVSALALPLIAATMLAATPFQVGLLAALGQLPFLVVGLVAGVWVDRLPRRPTLIAADLGRALVYAIVPAAWLFGALSLETLYAVALLAGTLTVFFDVAYLAYLPSLIDRRQLVAGNSRLEATASAAQIVGPGLGGLLVRLLGGPLTVLVDAVSFLFSAALLVRIRAVEAPPAPRHHDASFKQEIGEGFAVVRGSPILLPLVAATATLNLGGFAFLAVYLLFMSRGLGLDAGQIGMVYAIGGVGALVGTLAAEPARRRFGLGPTIVAGLFLFGATGLLVPVAVLVPAVALPMVVASEFLQWAALLVYAINVVSLRQAIVPDRLAGRVNATVRVVERGMQPVGSLLGGILGGAIGLAPTLVLGELGMLVAFLWLVASPIRSLREPAPIPDPDDAPAD